MFFLSFCLNKKNYCLYKYVQRTTVFINMFFLSFCLNKKNYCLYKYVLSVFLSS